MFIRQDDETLARRISEGDSEAENYLFKHLNERIRFLVRVRLRGRVIPEDQQDIISEIYKATLISLRKGKYDPQRGKPLEAYIAGIAGNIVGQYFRKEKKEALKKDIDQHQDIEYAGNILSELIENERRDRLKACLNKIKPKYLEVLILRFYENKTIDEIAQQLKLERRRISERINYAFKLLLKECKKDKYFQ